MTGILKVINVSGIKYAFNYKGRAIVIPYDERVYTLPNDVDRSQFGNVIKILQEIINIQKEPVIMVEFQPIQSDNNVIEIDLNDMTENEPVVDVGDVAEEPIKQKQERTTRTSQTKNKRGYTKKVKTMESKQSF